MSTINGNLQNAYQCNSIQATQAYNVAWSLLVFLIEL